MAIKVAIVGATGNVGRELLNIMDERDFPAAEVYALASRRSKGREVSFGDKTLKCEVLDDFDFSKVDVVLMSAGGTLSKQWAEKIGKQGAIVIDNSSAWRMDPDVPLVVPEVNGEDVLGYDKKMIIANPNCSTAQLVMALKPLHDAAKIKRVEDVGRHKIVRLETPGGEISAVVPEHFPIASDTDRITFEPGSVNVYENDWRIAPKGETA